jgi:TonB family protein
MKKYLSILILIGFSCFGQVNSNNSDSDKNDEVISFNKVDQIPIFENCKNEKKDIQRDCVINFINAHIEKNLKYPKETKKANVESKVFCTFIIDEEGKITITEAKGKPTSFKKAFENEAIRVLNLLPKFIPAKHNNQVVKVQAQYEVEFKLENTGIIRVSETVESYPVSVTAESYAEYLDEAVPFAVVEQIPLLKACKNVEKKEQINCLNEEIRKHIKNELKYPKEAEKDRIEDRVITLFEIDKNGKATNIKVRGKKSEYQLLFEAEAKRIIEALPQFSPGLQRGKPVVVAYYIPISFKLDK